MREDGRVKTAGAGSSGCRHEQRPGVTGGEGISQSSAIAAGKGDAWSQSRALQLGRGDHANCQPFAPGRQGCRRVRVGEGAGRTRRSDRQPPHIALVRRKGNAQHRLSHGTPSLSRSSFPPCGQLARYHWASSHDLTWGQVRRVRQEQLRARRHVGHNDPGR